MLKTALASSITTLAVCGIATQLFFNSLLGLFNLAAVPVQSLAALQQSRAIVSSMKKRHQAKKARLGKRFVKRAGRRVASSAIAASTVGTVAVIVTATGFEIADYCEEQASLQQDENLLFGTADTFDMDECLDEARRDSAEIMAAARDEAVDAIGSTWLEARQFTLTQFEDIRESLSEQLSGALEAGGSLWELVLTPDNGPP